MGTSATFTINDHGIKRHFVSFYDNYLTNVVNKLNLAGEFTSDFVTTWGDDLVEIRSPRDVATNYHYEVCVTGSGKITVVQSASAAHLEAGEHFGDVITLREATSEAAPAPAQAEKENTLRRSFIHNSRAWWYAASHDPNLYDVISISLYDKELRGEISIEWPTYVNAYQIRFFGDSVSAMLNCEDLMKSLEAFNSGLTPEQVCEILESLGFKDTTPEKNPHH